MGHPDKVADQISDAVLDAMLSADAHARVACEVMVTTGMVVVAGEVTCDGYVDISQLVRETVIGIGYDAGDLGFDEMTLVSLFKPGKTCGGTLASARGRGKLRKLATATPLRYRTRPHISVISLLTFGVPRVRYSGIRLDRLPRGDGQEEQEERWSAIDDPPGQRA